MPPLMRTPSIPSKKYGFVPTRPESLAKKYGSARMRPASLAKNTSRRTEAPPNACDRHQKNTTPCMPARVCGPRRAPGAPRAFRSASQAPSQARPRRSPGGAPAAKRPQALQALVSAAKQKPEAGVARRCQALLGGTQHSQQLLGAPRRCPIAPRRHQALPWRSHARPRRPPGNLPWSAIHWSPRPRAAPPLHRIGASPKYCA